MDLGEVKLHFGISDFGLENFELKRKSFPEESLNGTIKEWSIKEDAYGPCVDVNEPTRGEFISTVLTHVKHALNNNEIRLFREYVLKHGLKPR